MQRRKGEPLPNGWAQGPDGKETLDAGLVSFDLILIDIDTFLCPRSMFFILLQIYICFERWF